MSRRLNITQMSRRLNVLLYQQRCNPARAGSDCRNGTEGLQLIGSVWQRQVVGLISSNRQVSWSWCVYEQGGQGMASEQPWGCYTEVAAAAAAAESLQSCPTLCDPIDGSPPGSPIPGILQARTREWVVVSFTNTLREKPGQLCRPPWAFSARAALKSSTLEMDCWENLAFFSHIHSM